MDLEIEKSWRKVLTKEFSEPYYENLMSFVESEYNHFDVYPSRSNVFRAFEMCPFDSVKVVILGQDPYHTKGMADGLCFSVPSSAVKLPPSLRNIFKELNSDLGVEIRENGNLTSWAEQGVLMINTVLTVRDGVADSHSGRGWEQFTDAVIRELNARKTGVVYILWGSKAQSKVKGVDAELNLILKSPHPSPLSAHRGFFGCHHFSKTNEFLSSKKMKEISW